PPRHAVQLEILGHDARLHAVLLAQLGGDRLEPVGAARHQDQVDALRREAPRERRADARRRAGDQRPFAIGFQCRHVGGLSRLAGQCPEEYRGLTSPAAEEWTMEPTQDLAQFEPDPDGVGNLEPGTLPAAPEDDPQWIVWP